MSDPFSEVLQTIRRLYEEQVPSPTESVASGNPPVVAL
jgi:hypothetical protein